MKLLRIIVLIIAIFFLTSCKVKEYTITFDSNGGSVVEAITEKEGSLIGLPTPTREGYTFLGWYSGFDINDERFTNLTPLTKNLTLYAKWEIKKYLITFESNGGSTVAPVEVVYNHELPLPNNPYKDGYTFMGWYKNNSYQEVYDFNTKVTESFSLYANWKVKPDGVIDDVVVEYDSVNFSIDLSGFDVNYTSVSVMLYSEDQKVYELTDGINHDALTSLSINQLDKNTSYKLKIIASFLLNDITYTDEIIDEYLFSTTSWVKVYFDLRGGSFDHDQSFIFISPNDDFTRIPIPIKNECEFIGWQDENNQNITSVEQLSDNMTLNAIWQIQPVTIKFQVANSTIAQNLSSILDEFKNLYPHITVEIKVSYGYTDLRNSILNDIRIHQAPDLMMGYADHFAEYYACGVLSNLQVFIDDPVYGYSQQEIDDFINGYLLEVTGYNQTNDIFGLPFQKSTEMMIYNKTLFQAMYGENWANKIPKTWAEVDLVGKEIIQKLKTGNYDGYLGNYSQFQSFSSMIDNKKFYPLAIDSSSNGFMTITKQFGSDYVQRVNSDSGNILFNNEITYNALNYFNSLYLDGMITNAASFNSYYSSDAFKALQCLMVISSSAGIPYCVPDYGSFEIGVAPIPSYNDNKYVIQQGANLGILNTGSKNQQLAAWHLLKFLLEPENIAAFSIKVGGYYPVRYSAYELNSYQSYLLTDNYHTFGANVFYQDYLNNYNLFTHEVFVGTSAIREEVGNIFDTVFDSDFSLTKYNYHMTKFCAFVDREDQHQFDYEDEIQSIMLNDVSILTAGFTLPEFTLRNQIPITWSLHNNSNAISLVNNNNLFTLQVTRGLSWEQGVLRATINYNGEEQVREWKLVVKPNIIEIMSIENAKDASTYQNIVVLGVVTYKTANGIMISDNSGTIYVYGNIFDNVMVGSEIIVFGVKSVYYGMPQITSPSYVLLNEAPTNGFDYSFAPSVSIQDIINLNPIFNLSYGRIVTVEGVVKKNFNSTISEYSIYDEANNLMLYIYNSSNTEAKNELNQYVDKKVSLVVITYDFHSTQKVWRNLAVAGTIIEVLE